MRYIIMDLEWNQSFAGFDASRQGNERRGKEKGGKGKGRGGRERRAEGNAAQRKPELPFEIIEIGAVKLDEERNMLDSFHRIVCPMVYKRLHPFVRKMVSLEWSDLRRGMLFPEAAGEFLRWCGEDCRFGTWGESDLTVLQENMGFYHMRPLADGPFPYYDVQKLFSLYAEGKKECHALQNAVEYFGIEETGTFHRALCDAEYTARVFQRIPIDIVREYYSLDCFHRPRTKKDEVYVRYEGYSKRISREADTKGQLMEDADLQGLACCQCGKRAAKMTPWFPGDAKGLLCLGACKEHGDLRGHIRIRQTPQGRYYAVKTVRPISGEDAGQLRERYERWEAGQPAGRHGRKGAVRPLDGQEQKKTG